jgi:hypothetical protein
MYSLIWWSVMWWPGKGQFLISVKNLLPTRPAATASQRAPLRGHAVHRIRNVTRATPSCRHESGDTFSSRLTRHSHPVCRAADHVLMFKVLVLQASYSLSDERTEYLIRDRLSFMRFLGLGLADTVPDANTIWTFREALTRAKLRGKPAIEVLFKRFDAALSAAGFLAMGGQIIDATIVAAPKQRNTDGEKREIK